MCINRHYYKTKELNTMLTNGASYVGIGTLRDCGLAVGTMIQLGIDTSTF